MILPLQANKRSSLSKNLRTKILSSNYLSFKEIFFKPISISRASFYLILQRVILTTSYLKETGRKLSEPYFYITDYCLMSSQLSNFTIS